jgi:hypothetical protein
MVPDSSSPQGYGGVGILLQRLYVGFAFCRALARLLLGFGHVVVGLWPGCCWGIGLPLYCFFRGGAREHTRQV